LLEAGCCQVEIAKPGARGENPALRPLPRLMTKLSASCAVTIDNLLSTELARIKFMAVCIALRPRSALVR
jgi:hypothetical protein